MKIKSIIVIFVILMVVWLILNQSTDMQYLVTGLIFSAFLAIIFCNRCSVVEDIKFTPKAFLYTFLFLGVFLVELLKANVHMAITVLSPSLPINPGIVKANTKLNSKMARLILGNAITLTPGTFTIDIIDDTYYIHCVDLSDEDAEIHGQKIIEKFEKYLEVIYG